MSFVQDDKRLSFEQTKATEAFVFFCLSHSQFFVRLSLSLSIEKCLIQIFYEMKKGECQNKMFRNVDIRMAQYVDFQNLADNIWVRGYLAIKLSIISLNKVGHSMPKRIKFVEERIASRFIAHLARLCSQCCYPDLFSSISSLSSFSF